MAPKQQRPQVTAAVAVAPGVTAPYNNTRSSDAATVIAVAVAAAGAALGIMVVVTRSSSSSQDGALVSGW